MLKVTLLAAASFFLFGCGGGSASTAAAPVGPTAPLSVKSSSYANKAIAAEIVGSRALPREVSSSNSAAYADFFQEGEYSLVTHTLDYKFNDPTTSSQFGRIHFYKSQNGQWVDKTSDLLADTVGCLHPRKALVSDFNLDGRPDVFFACHGFDAAPFPGEMPHLLMSQPGGRYSNITLPFTGFFHGASAADINGDGFPDLVVTSFSKPYFLINNKNGTFTADTTRLPGSVNNKQIFAAELLDLAGAGVLDLFLGGHEQSGTWPATILKNDGNGNFAALPPLVLPSATGYGFAMDIVFTAGNIYLCRTIDAGDNFYGGAAVQRISYPALASSVPYIRSGNQPYSNGSKWINWIAPFQGRIVSMDSIYGLSIAQ